MKQLILCLLLIVGCSSSTELPKNVKEQIKVDLTKYPWAVDDLKEAIELCGEGVVEGVKGENRCSYKMRVNDLLLKDPMRKTGLIKEPNWPLKEGVSFFQSPPSVTIPDRLDLRESMKDGLPEIKNQECGDCWAWATHHGLEISRAVHDQKVFDHSPQTVLSCSNKGSCRGGYMSAVDFISHGLPLESEFPYTGRDTRCKYSKGDITTGWNGKVIGTPYIGSSKAYSRGAYLQGQEKIAAYEGQKVANIMRAMVQWKAPAVVTVQSFYVGPNEVYDSCSAINSDGNHMVALSGFEMKDGVRVAHVWNSHGPEFGDQGVGKIKWECGDGKLNRGLGYEAKIVQYKAPCVVPQAIVGKPEHLIIQGSSIKLGSPQSEKMKCEWSPTEGLETPHECTTYATPKMSTEYHLSVSNDCGTASAMTLVRVLSERMEFSTGILTPFGIVPE